MLKVKVFKSISPKDVEPAVQDWLNANPHVEITHLAQSQDGTGWVIVTILYK
ncbi:MAG: hypothetical protein H7308_20235 [Chthonomonadaceae bacterium]|nr:hypothetical protein [Chthonomonadaceae bacterium]